MKNLKRLEFYLTDVPAVMCDHLMDQRNMTLPALISSFYQINDLPGLNQNNGEVSWRWRRRRWGLLSFCSRAGRIHTGKHCCANCLM